MVKRIWLSIIIALLIITTIGCSAAEEEPPEEPAPASESEPVKNANAPADDSNAVANDSITEESSPAAQTGQRKWLVMLYQNADDEVLEEDIFIDFNEAELVGSSENVAIVSQIDRYEGGFDGDGDWTDTRRYLLTQDDDLDHIASEVVENMGELDSGDPQTLVDFALWAIENYPAEKYALILSDHGSGWLGGWTDNVPRPDSAFTLADIDNALGAIIEQSGIQEFEFVGYDACLMSQMEALSATAPHAKYAAASEEVEPSLGWAYASIFRSLEENPDMGGDELARVIVDSYIAEDTRILDDQARAKFVQDTYETTEEVSAEEVADEMIQDVTLTAVDLSKFSDLNAAINDLVIALTGVKQNKVATVRSYTQSFESVFGEEEPPSYIDLGHFVALIDDKFDDPAVKEAVADVRTTIKSALLAEKHGGNRPGATGFTIFFPVSSTYEWTVVPGSDPSYVDYAFRFSEASLWDEYLRFHYTGEEFDQTAFNLDILNPAVGAVAVEPVSPQEPTAVPAEPAEEEPAPAEEERAPVEEEPALAAEPAISAPGAGEFSISPLNVSASEILNNEMVTLTADIKGSNVAFIYVYTMYFDEESQSFIVADVDFVDAGETKEVEGVIFPDWGEESDIPLELEWEPTFYFLTDGNEENDQFALLEPKVYGVSQENDIYSVRGYYVFQASGNKRSAVMEFNGEGRMKRIITFTKENGTGAPREVNAAPGDQFEIIDTWLEFDQNPDGEFVDHPGGVMTFGTKPLEWVPYTGLPGTYLIGVVVEDFDGKTVESWTDEITVNEQ